jgi:DNA-binding NarL/FixJ family response regulator
LQQLPRAVVVALEEALAGEDVALVRGDEQLGTLSVRPTVLEGQLLAGPTDAHEQRKVREDVTVVATAMELSVSARDRLAEQFGEGFLVLDLHEAPSSADVLLVPPISPQLLGALRAQFPSARVLVAEIEDEELGVHCAGPVTRMLEAGADAYLPPRPVDEVARAVQRQLAGTDRALLDPGTHGSPRAGLPGPTVDEQRHRT